MGVNAQLQSLKHQVLNAQTIQIALQDHLEELRDYSARLEDKVAELRRDNETYNEVVDHYWGPMLDAVMLVIGRNRPMTFEEEPQIIMGGPYDGKVAITRKFFAKLEEALTNLETYLEVEAAKRADP